MKMERQRKAETGLYRLIKDRSLLREIRRKKTHDLDRANLEAFKTQDESGPFLGVNHSLIVLLSLLVSLVPKRRQQQIKVAYPLSTTAISTQELQPQNYNVQK